ncbi:hypothetical protein C0J52_23457 [Blattella germanica]|nr:hypothetical protein C0J52_23457 [Blattella germanica]
MVRKFENRFRETGFVLDKKPKIHRRVIIEEKLKKIGQKLQRSPRKSLSTEVQ